MSVGAYRAPEQKEAWPESQAKVADDGPEEAARQRHAHQRFRQPQHLRLFEGWGYGVRVVVTSKTGTSKTG